jgi:hypothetical protein
LQEIQESVTRVADGQGVLAHGCLAIQEGFTALMPLVLPAKTPRYALALAGVASFEGATASWNPSAALLSVVAEKTAASVAFTGRGRPLRGDEPGCPIAEAGQRPVYRVLAPFPHELTRKDRRFIPFEELVTDAPSGSLRPELEGKLVLIGIQRPNEDVIETCASDGCDKIHGLSLHAAAIDTLFGDEKARGISIISPALQLAWIALLCSAGAILRFVTSRRSSFVRFGFLAGLMLLDVLLTALLAAKMALLVDTLHHLAALCLCYYIVTLIEPAKPATKGRALS